MVKRYHYIRLIAICIFLLKISANNRIFAKISNTVERLVKNQVNSYNNYDVKFYKLDLQVSDSSIYLNGSVTIQFEITGKPGDQIILELVNNYTVDSVVSELSRLNFTHQSDSITIQLDKIFDIGDVGNVTVFYHGKGTGNGTQKGIYNAKSSVNNKRYTWTLSEPFAAKYWFPCRQVLTDKADSVYVYITTNSNLLAGSNGLLTNSVKLPGNKTRYEWRSKYPIAYYLISIAVGDYIDYSFYSPLPEGDSLLVQNYIYNDSVYFSENKKGIDATSEILVIFSRLFGRYPFADEKYGHCVVPLGGGMEHQTMTTLSGFSFGLVAHELAHQWFGDYVTCSTWQDIWINEGFASYAEYLALEHIKTEFDAKSWLANAHKVIKNQPEGSVYVPDDEATNEWRIFSMPLSYKKGAAIIHMIRQEIGDDNLFFEILREFITTFKNSNASAEDFRKILAKKTDKDFNIFFEQWFYGEGYPRFKINWLTASDTLFIYSLEEATSEKTPFFNTLIEFGVQLPEGKDTLIAFRQTNNYNEFKAYIPYPVQGLIFDPNIWLLSNLDSFIHITESIDPNSLYIVNPNPLKEKLNIRFNNDPGEYQYYLFDLSGRLILTSKSRLKHLEIDLKSLKTGNYVIVILKDEKQFTTKIIKN